MKKRKESTYGVNHGVAIGEAASWAAIEINAIRKVVSFSKRRQIIVVAIVDQGITKDEHGWD